MSTDEFDKYWNERYLDQLSWYDRKAIMNQKGHKVSQLAILVISATTPLVALGATKWWAAVLAASIVLVNGVARLYRFEENWMSYRTTCELMRKEQHLFLAKSDLGGFYVRVR